ncbi:hypothetical protein R6Q59_014323 [Mikania micrantha]|uniref:PB1 domain-containing protein n=1 Tax=Mikania micrantha TaxID=192012 RepID=A0A5N6N5V8_9ASTR|nr:hypothetical protein E3N88_25838 [Mikania micrantha]
MTRIKNSVNNLSSPAPETIKFLYSYGGKILPRQTDGKLRYVGGHTRVLAVDRSVAYAVLIVKFWESCGFSVNLKCKLPSEDLDVLVSVTSDEDLAAVLKEYDQFSPDAKIRAVLFPVSSLKTISPVPSFESLVNFAESKRLPNQARQQRRWIDRRNILSGRSCSYNPLLTSRFSHDTIPKNFFFHDRNIQWLNKKQF